MEKRWRDTHASLIGYVRDALQPQLADDLVARMEERVYVENEEPKAISHRNPDVYVAKEPVTWHPRPGQATTAVAEEPLLLEPLKDPQFERFIEITEAGGERIITAIEILSPRNKRSGDGLQDYMVKRREYLDSNANLVEIDLVRTGDWTEMIGPYRVPDGAHSTYRVTVVQSVPRRTYLYPIPLRGRLPTIKIPLRPIDTPARINLQELVEKAYEMGRYDRTNYAEPCLPPLSAEEAEWVKELLKADRKP